MEEDDEDEEEEALRLRLPGKAQDYYSRTMTVEVVGTQESAEVCMTIRLRTHARTHARKTLRFLSCR